MTEPPEPHGPEPDGEAAEGGAEVRHLPVLVPPPEPRVLDRPRATVPSPVVAATGGVLVGIMTMVLVRLARARPRTIVLHRRRRGDRGLEVTASRSFLVDVHLLRR
jgi:hypothetical protein